MGAITSIATMVGGIAAGSGAMIITEGAVMSFGRQIVGSNKLTCFCVDMCAFTLGSAAFDKVNDMFTDQAVEFWSAIDKVKANLTVKKGDKTIVDIHTPEKEAEAE